MSQDQKQRPAIDKPGGLLGPGDGAPPVERNPVEELSAADRMRHAIDTAGGARAKVGVRTQVTTGAKTVVIDFGRPVSLVETPPDDARRLAALILSACDKADGIIDRPKDGLIL